MSYLVLHTNGVYITLVLSVVNQKMKAYLQELILGTFIVTFFFSFATEVHDGVRWKFIFGLFLLMNDGDKSSQIGPQTYLGVEVSII